MVSHLKVLRGATPLMRSIGLGSVLEFLDLFSAGGTISSGTTTSECDTTMKTILIAAALLCSVEVRAMAESTVTFEADAVGAAPKGWTATKTGRGDQRWTIEQDQTAPSKSKIVKQSGTATYPLLLNDNTQIQDGFIEVMFKAIAGSED